MEKLILIASMTLIFLKIPYNTTTVFILYDESAESLFHSTAPLLLVSSATMPTSLEES